MKIHRRIPWGLGFDIDRGGVVADDFSTEWIVWTWRIYVGPWFIIFNTRVTPKRAFKP